mgnify:CR=1 FL=1
MNYWGPAREHEAARKYLHENCASAAVIFALTATRRRRPIGNLSKGPPGVEVKPSPRYAWTQKQCEGALKKVEATLKKALPGSLSAGRKLRRISLRFHPEPVLIHLIYPAGNPV